MHLKISLRIMDGDGEKVFGSGVVELLRKIEETGSLNRAARSMDLAYSKAWKILAEAEKRLGITFIERTIGGAHEGGSRLTDEGRDFLERYEKFDRRVRRQAEDEFAAAFPEWKKETEG